MLEPKNHVYFFLHHPLYFIIQKATVQGMDLQMKQTFIMTLENGIILTPWTFYNSEFIG